MSKSVFRHSIKFSTHASRWACKMSFALSFLFGVGATIGEITHAEHWELMLAASAGFFGYGLKLARGCDPTDSLNRTEPEDKSSCIRGQNSR